jgi:Protein of unknown function (DUF2934)
MDNREERIRQKAHELWEQAGRPQDKAKEHWAEAERLVDKEDHESDTDKLANEPNPRHEAVDIAPGPEGDIHPIPAAAVGSRRR